MRIDSKTQQLSG